MNTRPCLFAVGFILTVLVAPASAASKPTWLTPKGFTPKLSSHSASHPGSKPGTEPPIGFTQTGKASFYGGYWDGRLTANGEVYHQNTLTAAHKTLPFNSKVRVRNLLNNREVVVRINNRGPYVSGRIIDLSVAAASRLEMRKSGVVPVEICVVQ